MRAWLVACAALALAHAAAPVAPPPLTPHTPHSAHSAHTSPHPRSPHLDPARLDHIKSQILSKLGLSTRPTPQGAPPRDVVRQILARAADPHPPPHHHDEDASMREIIAIAHREGPIEIFFVSSLAQRTQKQRPLRTIDGLKGSFLQEELQKLVWKKIT